MFLKCLFCGRFMRMWTYTRCIFVNSEGNHFVCVDYKTHPREIYEDVVPKWLW